jgi:hypothetical protein
MAHQRLRLLVVASIVGAAAAVGLVSPAQAHDTCASQSGQFCVYRFGDSNATVAHWGAGDTNLNYAGDVYHGGSGGGLNDSVTRARNTSSSIYMALWEHSWNTGDGRCVAPGQNRNFWNTSFDNVASSHAQVRSAYC